MKDALAKKHHERTLALFLALMCDRDLFKKVYTKKGFNADAFKKYMKNWKKRKKDDIFKEPLMRLEKDRDAVKDAQTSWFTLVGADYSGPACPTKKYLKEIVVIIEGL